MNKDRRTAVVAGVLFIVATTASLIGRVALLDPLLKGADILAKIAANQSQVAAGSLFGLLGFFTSASIAIALYPVLRRYSEGLALGAVGLRIIEGVLYSIGAIAVLSTLTLARGLVEAGAPSASFLQASAALLMAVRSWAGLAGTLAFYPAGLLYYIVFYRSRLVPRWLSGWGVVAVTMGFTASILVVFQAIVPMSTPQIVLNLPIFLQEMVLAVWLIAKGFDPIRARLREGLGVKAVVCTRYGPPEVLRLEEVATPVPRKNEVRIRIGATAVTSSDCYLRGLRLPPAYRMMARLAVGWNAPRQPVLGMVLSGEVDSIGPDVRSFQVRDRVFGFNKDLFGTYAQYVCWPEDGLLATRPANLTDEEAAAIPYGGLIALSYLRKAGVRAGQSVLIFGASGAVGTSAVQLARYLGADVTGVCSTANVELVTSLGAANVVDYTVEDFVDGEERYDVILDAVGKRKSAAALRRSRQVLAPGGGCISVDDGTPKLLREDLVLLGELAARGEIRPVIDRTYVLDDIVEAHRYVDKGHKRGNVIITVP